MTSERARRLHASPWQGVLYVTGGGTALVSELLSTAGASNTVLEASIPYSGQSLAELLGAAPEQACSAQTARAMAMTAFQRAMALGAATPFGFAITASLATNRAKRGQTRAHIALQTTEHTSAGYFELTGERTNQEQELVEIAWRAINAGLDLQASGAPLPAVQAPEPWRELVLGRTKAAATRQHAGQLLFPGSFNPLHDGHRAMMAIAELRLGLPGAYELSIENPDKPLLDYVAIDERLTQFRHPVWLTRLPTFPMKARAFPNAHLIVGIDTLIRIAEPRYYGDEAARDRELAIMAAHGARFVVFGRVIDESHSTIADFDLPDVLVAMCDEVTEAEFRMDVSSTDIRGDSG